MRAWTIAAVFLMAIVSTPAWAEDVPMGPTGAAPPPPPPAAPAAPLARSPVALPPAACNLCEVDCCYQRRDACGWPIDCNGCPYGRFEVVLEGTYGMIPSPDGLLGDLAIGALAPQFDWDELDYDGSFGGRGAIRYAVAPLSWIELRGAYYGSWDESTSRTGTLGFRPGLNLPGTPQTSRPVDATMESEATAWGAELNYQQELMCSGRLRTDLILGLRYFHFEEEAQVGFADAPILDFDGPASVKSETSTDFVGLQIGGVVHVDLTQKLEVYGLAKIMGGWARNDVDVNDRSIFAGGSHSASDDEDSLIWGGEIELGLRWRLLRCLSVQAGYNLFALEGVQRAYDAMDFSQSTSGAVQTRMVTDEILIHSVFVGFTVSF